MSLLIVSARGEELSKVKGLELGADDYIVKPFSHAELSARIEAVMRRAKRQEALAESVFNSMGLTLDLAARYVEADGKKVKLTALECKLLAYLLRHEGKLVPTRVLAQRVWASEDTNTALVRMAVHRLRRKLGDLPGPVIIRSLRGMGYSLSLPIPGTSGNHS
mgnify:CR=1 FL=1